MGYIMLQAKTMSPVTRVKVADAWLGGHPVLSYEKRGREIIAVPYLFHATVDDAQRSPVSVKEIAPYTEPGDIRKVQISVRPDIAQSTADLYRRVEKSITSLTVNPRYFNAERPYAWTWGSRFGFLSSLAENESFGPKGVITANIQDGANNWLYCQSKDRMHTTIAGKTKSDTYAQFSRFYLVFSRCKTVVRPSGNTEIRSAWDRDGNSLTTYPVLITRKAALRPLNIIKAIDRVAMENCLNGPVGVDDQNWDDFMRARFLLHLVSMFQKP